MIYHPASLYNVRVTTTKGVVGRFDVAAMDRMQAASVGHAWAAKQGLSSFRVDVHRRKSHTQALFIPSV